MSGLALLPVHQLSRELAVRRVSPVEVVEAFLARIERLDPKLRSYVALRIGWAWQHASEWHEWRPPEPTPG